MSVNNPKTIEEARSDEQVSYEDEWASQWGADDTNEQDAIENEEGVDEEVDEDVTDVVTQDAVTAPATPAAPADPFAWINNLPEKVREQAEQLKHSALSDQGRVAAYNKQLAELKRELEAAKRYAATAVPVPAEQKPSASAAPELPAKFKQLKEDFPEFAEAVEELRAIDRAQYEARFTEAVSPIERMRVREQRAIFAEAVSAGTAEFLPTDDPEWNWEVVAKSKDFLAWLDMQPESVQDAARVPKPVEALNVLRRYKQDWDVAVSQMLPPTVTEGASTQKADAIKHRRDQRKRTAVVPGSKPVATDPNLINGDYEAEFNARWA